jgi:hypothetical protein
MVIACYIHAPVCQGEPVHFDWASEGKLAITI